MIYNTACVVVTLFDVIGGAIATSRWGSLFEFYTDDLFLPQCSRVGFPTAMITVGVLQRSMNRALSRIGDSPEPLGVPFTVSSPSALAAGS
jgi:hypothetical protein